jgi:hypothetical protein
MPRWEIGFPQVNRQAVPKLLALYPLYSRSDDFKLTTSTMFGFYVHFELFAQLRTPLQPFCGTQVKFMREPSIFEHERSVIQIALRL